MREGQRERRRMVDTNRAFQFKLGSYHAIQPGKKKPAKELLREPKVREPKAAGGLMRAAKKLKEMQDRRRS